jgi:hypothetical protein
MIPFAPLQYKKWEGDQERKERADEELYFSESEEVT